MRSRLFDRIFHAEVMADADRLIEGHGESAIHIAKQSRIGAGETDKRGHWSRVIGEIERRSEQRR